METSHWKRILIGLIDVSIAMALLYWMMTNQSPRLLYTLWTEFNQCLSLLLWLALYRLICIFLFKGTIGMKIFKVQFLTGELEIPSTGEYILASFFLLTNGIGYYDCQTLDAS